MSVFANRLSQALTAPRFVQQLHQFPRVHRDTMIGHAINYHVLFPDGKNFDCFMDRQLGRIQDSERKYDCELHGCVDLVGEIAERLLCEHRDDTYTGSRQFLEYYSERYLTNGYVFHGFNGVFRESNELHGLSLNTRIWDADAFEEVAAIQVKQGDENFSYHRSFASLALGCGEVSGGGIYVNGHPFGAHHYASTSPEWFGIFSAGEYISRPEPHRNRAFERRDHVTALANVEEMCGSFGLSMGERTKVLDFFERSWTLFANAQSNKLYCALIERGAVTLHGFTEFQTFDEIEETYLGPGCYHARQGPFKQAAEGIQGSMNGMINEKITETIPREAIHIVELPSYADVFPEDL